MAVFRYRAATAAGALRTGRIEAESGPAALDLLRGQGLRPISAVRATAGGAGTGGGASVPRGLLARGLAETATMLEAGVPLDRALAVVTDTLEAPAGRAVFARLLHRVREGAPLSRALGEAGSAFPPMAAAMSAAGEANGRLGRALDELADALQRGAALQALVVSALIYPALLCVIAGGVVALMLWWVVPQFAGLFAENGAALPLATRVVLGASAGARRFGLPALLALGLAFALLWRWGRTPGGRAVADRLGLALPLVGPIVRAVEAARFSRVLASLVQGGVALPEALAIAAGALGNGVMRGAIAEVAVRLRQGGGLSGPLAQARVLPPLAISYLRTGEETARLGPMLSRLADTLDRDVKLRLERMIAVATPAITVAMGAVVAGVIASIMSAILGFDDLALSR